MTLAEIQGTIYDTFGMPAAPDTVTTARILRYINLSYHRVMGMKGIGPRLRRSLQSFSTVANSPFATLPDAVVKIHYLSDRTNNNPLTEMSLGDIRYQDPGLTAVASVPYHYTIYNLADWVSRDPSASGQITAVSDNALDTGSASYRVYIEYIDSTGYPLIDYTNLSGLTPVNVGHNNAVQVRKVYLAFPTYGSITVKDGAANTIVFIRANQTRGRFTRLHLFPTPSAAVTLYADTELHIENLAVAYDEPLFPEDFHSILVHGAQAREFIKRDKTELAGREMSEMNRVIGEMRIWMNSPTGVAYGRNNRPSRFSQLGPYYPNGS